MRALFLEAAAWVTMRHMAHFEANRKLAASIGQFFMRRIDRKAYDYHQAISEQGSALTELKALSAAFEIKEMAHSQNGWEDHHGIGLDMVAGVLMEQTEWEPNDIDDFVERLTEGFFSYGAAEDED